MLDSIIRNGPSGSGFDNGTELADESTSERLVLVVTGRNRRGIKDYIGEVFHEWLTGECKE